MSEDKTKDLEENLEENDEEKTEQIVEEENSVGNNYEESMEADDQSEKISQLEKEIEELKDSMMRVQADYQNYQRRTADESSKRYEAGKANLAEDILPVIDNLERAIDSMEEQGLDPENIKGVSLIEEQFHEVLEKNNIIEIKALDEKFDPNFHYAVATVEMDEVDSGVVVDVLQRGYMINETIIRPAMVRVSE